MMKAVYRFLAGFIDLRHSIKARIFLSLFGVTIIITMFISIYWYRRIIQSTTDTVMDSMEKNMSSGFARLEFSLHDVKLMHFTVIYESNCWNYFVRDVTNAPSSEWFTVYQRLYNSLRMMGITMSRTISGTGVYKTEDATCINGVLGVPYRFSQFREFFPSGTAVKGEELFFLDKPPGERSGEVVKYVYIGRTIMDYGEEKALILSKLNDRVFTDAFSEILYPDGFTMILNRDNSIIYDSALGKLSGRKDDLRRQLAEKRDTISINDYIAIYKKSDSFDITVVSAMPTHYLREHYSHVRFQFFAILFGAVLAEAFLSMLVSNQITQGLRILEHNMERIGDGSMTELSSIRRQDEVGRLSRTYVRMIGQIKKLMEDIKEKEYQKRQMEIRLLRAQISPHFLYNALNTIGYLAQMQNVKNIHKLVISLIELLRGAVSVDDVLVPLSEEISYVQNYLNIQQYRYQQQIRVDLRLDELIGRCLVPKMILQPIVENALIHGLKAEHETPSVIIKAYVLEGQLVLSVTDNGIGMNKEKIQEIMAKSINPEEPCFFGHGISNVYARIRLQFGERSGLSIFSRERLFTTVEIRLPAAGIVHEAPAGMKTGTGLL
jgi:sensor histidine kinase YesM